MSGTLPQWERLYERAMRKLACGDCTPRGLYLWLIGYEREEVDHESAKAVVKQLHKEGFINEKRYFENLLADAERKLYGPERIKLELRKREFSPKYLLAFEESDIDFDMRALELAKKLFPHSALDAAQKRRLYSRLAAKGYHSEQINFAINHIADGGQALG